MPAVSRDATDRVLEAVDALNDRDYDRFTAVHDEEAAFHDHGKTARGVEAAVAHEREIVGAFPDNRYDVESVVAEGDTIAARWTVTGTHGAEFQGIPPTGAAVASPAMGVTTVEDDEIDGVWSVYDRLGVMRQLGVIGEV